MRRRVLGIGGLATLLLLGLPKLVRAEGSEQLGITQSLGMASPLFVDIVDPTTETFVWTGEGGVQVTAPNEVSLGDFASGAVITPLVDVGGAYRIGVHRAQYDVDSNNNIIARYDWDLTVYESGSPQSGRLWSPRWILNAGNYDDGCEASLFVVADGGAPEREVVVELQLAGWAGFAYEVVANRSGPLHADGRRLGRAIESSSVASLSPEFRIYLSPPPVAGQGALQPTLSDAAWNGWLGAGEGTCDLLALGADPGRFTFTTDVTGTYHLVCDVDDDGSFDLGSEADLHLLGAAAPGVNVVSWDGTDAAGAPVALGHHDCLLRVTTGEVHLVASDIETSFPGFRLYVLGAQDERVPLRLFWNDTWVQSEDILMPLYGADSGRRYAPMTPGPAGLLAGAASAAPEPYRSPGQFDSLGIGDARAWGAFTFGGKGDANVLDTFAWLAEAVSSPLTVHVVDAATDSDDDGLADYVETCVLGSDPDVADTDLDTIDDGVDNCVLTANVGQDDLDDDGMGDLCDVCPAAFDPDQADRDGDGEGDACDCGDGVAVEGEACDEGEGNGLTACGCSAGCEYPGPQAACADSTYCDGVEHCDGAGACVDGAPLACDDGIACTEDTCDDANDVCVHVPDDASCDDGLWCNGPELCSASAGCEPGSAPCDGPDGDSDCAESCDEVEASCTAADSDGAPCDDGVECNGSDACDKGECRMHSGVCEGGAGGVGGLGGGGAAGDGGVGAADGGMGGDGTSPETGEDGGCSCRLASGAAVRGAWARVGLGLVAMALALLRRSRGQRCGRASAAGSGPSGSA